MEIVCGIRAAERELPVVYTEVDGGFNDGGFNGGGNVPRWISWETSMRSSRESGGLRRAFRSFFSFFGRLRITSSTSRSRSEPRGSHSNLVFSRSWRRRQRGQPAALDDDRW